jgi:murein L,D-transpeptidase YcbB/YkuD
MKFYKYVLIGVIGLFSNCLVSASPVVLDSVVVSGMIKHAKYQDYTNELMTLYRGQNFQALWFDDQGMPTVRKDMLNSMMVRYSSSKQFTQDIQPALSFFSTVYAMSPNEILSNINDLDLHLSSILIAFVAKEYPNDELLVINWLLPPVKYSNNLAIKQLTKTKQQIDSKNIAYNPQIDMLFRQLPFFESLDANKSISWGKLLAPAKGISLNDSNPLIKDIKKRMSFLNLYVSSDTSMVYNQSLNSAILVFQKTRGLAEDGVIGKGVILELNKTPSDIISTILSNINRLVWYPPVTFYENIVVNIPAFQFDIYKNGELQWINKVIDGKPDTPTAIFSADLKYIVFSPYWVIPASIANKEIVPKIKSNYSYLTKQDLEIIDGSGNVISPSSINWSLYPSEDFPYTIRQLPGEENSLGKVKFLFPNIYNIYLHDTPTKPLFSTPVRDYSHGCVRIQNPELLAYFLLADNSEWTKNKIDAAMDSDTESWVILSNTVNVTIGYFTAWVDDTGALNIRNDIYVYDN